MDYDDIKNKMINVIYSCETSEQLIMAVTYCNLLISKKARSSYDKILLRNSLLLNSQVKRMTIFQ